MANLRYRITWKIHGTFLEWDDLDTKAYSIIQRPSSRRGIAMGVSRHDQFKSMLKDDILRLETNRAICTIVEVT